MAIAENASNKRCTYCLKYKSEFEVSFQFLLMPNEGHSLEQKNANSSNNDDTFSG